MGSEVVRPGPNVGVVGGSNPSVDGVVADGLDRWGEVGTVRGPEFLDDPASNRVVGLVPEGDVSLHEVQIHLVHYSSFPLAVIADCTLPALRLRRSRSEE